MECKCLEVILSLNAEQLNFEYEDGVRSNQAPSTAGSVREVRRDGHLTVGKKKRHRKKDSEHPESATNSKSPPSLLSAASSCAYLCYMLLLPSADLIDGTGRHKLQDFSPSRNDLRDAERGGFAARVRRIELLAVNRRAAVVHAHGVGTSRLVASTAGRQHLQADKRKRQQTSAQSNELSSATLSMQHPTLLPPLPPY